MCFVSRLRIPRTDIATGVSARVLYFAGGCGVDAPSPPADDPYQQGAMGGGADAGDKDDSSPRIEEPARREAGGDAEGSAPDLPLLVRRCQATDVVDVFAPMGKTGGVRGGRPSGGDVAVGATDSIRWDGKTPGPLSFDFFDMVRYCWLSHHQ